jgi:hypothetical protein
MPFPNSPTNGQLATVNNLVYIYNSTKSAWNKANIAAALSGFSGNILVSSISVSNSTASINTTTGALVVTGLATFGAGISITGAGNRITGDFSNATVANRVLFQSSTTNGATSVGVIPNGTQLNSSFSAFNNSDPTNAAFAGIGTTGGTEARIQSGITGTGTYLPMTFYTGGSERVRIDQTTGNVVIAPTTTSTTTTTGALVVRGGVGVAGNVVVSESVISNTAGGIGSVSSRFTVNTAAKADFHITSTINGLSATATQQYGITFAPLGGLTQAAILIAENGADGTAIGFATTNSYAGGPVIRTIIDPTGHLVPAANAAYDLGSTTLRWRNIYTNDLNLSNGRGDYTIVEGEEDLFLYNNRSGKTYKFVIQEVDPATVPPKAKQD